MEIRAATAGDFDAMWAIFKAAIAMEDSLPFAGTFEAGTFRSHWFGVQAAFVAYVVDARAQGQGVDRALVEHNLERARAEGFLATQSNYVVSINGPAVALYRKLGFDLVGTLLRDVTEGVPPWGAGVG